MLPGFSHILPEIRIFNLRITPPKPIYEEIMGFKKQFIDAFGIHDLVKSKPHITLCAFAISEDFEGKVVKTFNKLAQMEPFDVVLDSFGIFENTNVLYINSSLQTQIKALHEEFRLLLTMNLGLKLKNVNIVEQYHMTISKTETDDILNQSLKYFKQFDYQRTFKVSELFLVGRYQGKTWDWEHKIQLKGS